MAKTVFNEERCKGCGLCVGACPKGIVKLLKERINQKGYHPAGVEGHDKCTGCAACAMMCPDCVIEVER